MKDDYYLLIRNKLIDNEIYKRVKYYSKEKNKVITNFDIGRLLYEAGSRYGDNIIGEYSNKLEVDVGKKYTDRYLRYMRKFYTIFKNEKWKPLVSKLTWSHILLILPLRDDNEIIYYLNNVIYKNQIKRELQDSIKSKEYYRIPIKTRNKLINNTKLELKDTIKDPIIIKTDKDVINEKVLQRVILEDIPSFLKSLGEGFTFIDNEYRIKIDDKYNYIDILAFNIEYNCYVVVELKVTRI